MANRTSFKAALCAALLALSTSAPANTQEDPLFDKLDVDMDGFISRTEAVKEPRVAERFETLDSNKDDRLDKLEFEALQVQDKPLPEPAPTP